MKRFLTVLFTLALVMGIACTDAAADTETLVYVSIQDADGNLAMAGVQVAVTDIDGDGALTINDALYAAHEQAYPGGAAEGYASEYGAYGLSLTRLWGCTNGGSYGYYVNNASAWSLADPVVSGDRIYAFVYTAADWSDTYCYFDNEAADVSEGDTLSLTLLASAYDENWNPVTKAVAGAEITLNGEKTGIVTDENGKAEITIDKAGFYTVSAVTDSFVMTPPVCIVNAAAAEDSTPMLILPQTGVSGALIWIVSGLLMMTAGFCIIRRK